MAHQVNNLLVMPKTRHQLVRRRKWHPTPVFLPEKSHEQGSLAGYSPKDHKKSDITERLNII